jgi:hypothetical protein
MMIILCIGNEQRSTLGRGAFWWYHGCGSSCGSAVWPASVVVAAAVRINTYVSVVGEAKTGGLGSTGIKHVHVGKLFLHYISLT